MLAHNYEVQVLFFLYGNRILHPSDLPSKTDTGYTVLMILGLSAQTGGYDGLPQKRYFRVEV